jgi:uncharacterized protein involved in exopolysaccharide biosynthesis
MPKKKITPLNEDFDFKLFATIAKKNFLWFVSFLFTSLIIAFLVLRYNPPVYESTSIIKISSDNEAQTALNISRDMLANMSQSQLAGYIEILRSKIIGERMVEALPLDVSYFLKGRVLDNELYRVSPFRVDYEVLPRWASGTTSVSGTTARLPCR